MRDILRVVTLGFYLMVVVDVDGSVWRRQDNQRLFAKLLVSCLNGQGFTLSRTVVLCDVTELAPIEPSGSRTKSAPLP